MRVKDFDVICVEKSCNLSAIQKILSEYPYVFVYE